MDCQHNNINHKYNNSDNNTNRITKYLMLIYETNILFNISQRNIDNLFILLFFLMVSIIIYNYRTNNSHVFKFLQKRYLA